MRKTFFLHPILWAAMVVIFSCQKEAEKANSNDQLISKVNAWLEKQKEGLLEFKASNVDLLKKNLEYSSLRIEQSGEGEQIVIIPITERFKAQKNIDNNSIPNLVLQLNNTGDIRKGNVVLFKPKINGRYSKVPDNTFYNIFNTSKVNCDGLFQFLSVAGHWDYQLDYINGNLNSLGLIKVKEDPISDTRTNTICIHWYLVTTYYVNGVIVAQTTEYVGTTCREQCGDGSYQSLCPDGTSSSGGGGSGNDSENCDNPLTGSVSSAIDAIITSSDDGITRTKTYKWTIYQGGGNTWRFNSLETGVHKRVNNEWQWESITHNSVTRAGLMLGGDVQCTSHTGIPTLGIYNAAMTVMYNLQFSVVCQGFPITTNGDFTSTKFFNVND